MWKWRGCLVPDCGITSAAFSGMGPDLAWEGVSSRLGGKQGASQVIRTPVTESQVLASHKEGAGWTHKDNDQKGH